MNGTPTPKPPNRVQSFFGNRMFGKPAPLALPSMHQKEIFSAMRLQVQRTKGRA